MLKKSIYLILLLSTTTIFASTQTTYEQKCGICHGNDGMKLAMGKSKAIKGMEIEEIKNAMNDYAKGNRKTTVLVKNIKKNFIKATDENELNELFLYINKL